MWGTSREQRLDEFRKGLKSVGYNESDRTFADLNVTPYSAAADVNTMEKSVKYGSLMKPETFGAKGGSLEFVDINGKVTKNPMDAISVYHHTQSGERRLLKDADIQSAVREAMLNDSEVKAMIDRDLKYLNIDPDNRKQAIAYDEYLEKTIYGPARTAGTLLKINDNTLKNDVTMSGGVRNVNTADAKEAEKIVLVLIFLIILILKTKLPLLENLTKKVI